MNNSSTPDFIAELRNILSPYLAATQVVIALLYFVLGGAGDRWPLVLALLGFQMVVNIALVLGSRKFKNESVLSYSYAFFNWILCVPIVVITGGYPSFFWITFVVGAIQSGLFMGRTGVYLNAAFAGIALGIPRLEHLTTMTTLGIGLQMLFLLALGLSTEKSTALLVNERAKYKRAEEALRQSNDRLRFSLEKQEQQAREKDILLKEIHHRVKNNLQMISSLLMLQSEATRSEQVLAALSQSRDRIYSMAIIHEMLYRSTDLSQVDLAAYTRQLTDHLKHSYDIGARGITLKISPGEVSLDADAVIYCGLIIHELISNALRHAFPEGRSGEICIDLTSESDRVILTVSDNGVGLPPDVEPTSVDSLGFQLVTMLTNQLGGAVELDRSGGTKVSIVFGQQSDVCVSRREKDVGLRGLADRQEVRK